MSLSFDEGPHIIKSRTNADKLKYEDAECPIAHLSHGPGQPQARTPGYTTHIRSASRITWDGREPLPRSRSLSSSHGPIPSRLTSPLRPSSAISLPNSRVPEHTRPTALADRWSYDRERMPSPPPAPRGSRPGTPAGDRDGSETRPSRPTSTLGVSPASSTAPSGLFDRNSSADLDDSPLQFSDFDQVGQHLSPHLRRSCHILTDEEMEMLARPPLAHPPMTASSRPASPDSERDAYKPAAPGRGPESTCGIHLPKPFPSKEDLGGRLDRHGVIHGGDHSLDVGPGCLGSCDIAPARAILGKFGAWLMGVVMPVSFGLLTGCLTSTISGCR
ncbi:hypothetical protein VTH06DRAFT_2806 [Thermothelomyces fergusii]